MAEASQFTFELSELTTLLIKEQSLHEGLWTVAFEFGLGAAILGPTPEQAKPSAIVSIMRVQLVRQPAEQPNPLALDAAKVNPKGGGEVKSRRRRNA